MDKRSARPNLGKYAIAHSEGASFLLTPTTSQSVIFCQLHTKMASSILTRKRDLIYLIFFITHLPVMLGKPHLAFRPLYALYFVFQTAYVVFIALNLQFLTFHAFEEKRDKILHEIYYVDVHSCSLTLLQHLT